MNFVNVPIIAIISSLLELCLGLRTISTDDWKETKVYVEVLNSSLKDYEEFTLCGRFQTYQFRADVEEDEFQSIISVEDYYMLGSYIALPCGEICTGSHQAMVGSGWKYKKVFGFSEFGSDDSYSYFPSWLPWTWTSVCISASKPQGYMEVTVNGEKVGRTDRYTGYYQDVDRNIVLMNYDGGLNPSLGAFTDLNIWSRILSDQEVEDWTFCRRDLPGRLLAWETAELNMTGFKVLEIARNETCLQRTAPSNYVAFNIEKDFDGSENFCRNIGGKFAVVRDQESLIDISGIFGDICDYQYWFYAGLTQRQEQWVDVVTGQADWSTSMSRNVPILWHEEQARRIQSPILLACSSLVNKR